MKTERIASCQSVPSMQTVELYIRDVVSNPGVIHENNQHIIKLSTDKQHPIIGMHNLEQKHITHCRLVRCTRLMMLGGGIFRRSQSCRPTGDPSSACVVEKKLTLV